MQTLGDREEKHGGLKGAPGGLMVEADSRQAGTIDGSLSKGVVGAQERLLQKEKPRTGSHGSLGGSGRILSARFHWVTWNCCPLALALLFHDFPFTRGVTAWKWGLFDSSLGSHSSDVKTLMSANPLWLKDVIL